MPAGDVDKSGMDVAEGLGKPGVPAGAEVFFFAPDEGPMRTFLMESGSLFEVVANRSPSPQPVTRQSSPKQADASE
jgi:hypothetical protein